MHATGSDLLVLHTVRCVGVAGSARLAEAAALPEPDVESELIDLAVAGLVTRLPGEFGGWSLTEAGRASDAARIRDELDATGARPVVTRAYGDFLVLNPELLDIFTAWQLRPDDRARVLAALADFHLRADPVCAELAGALLRFRRYRDRLARALARARAGEREYVTNDLASYHTVWFQLHEDLLVTLGIPR
ncbi:transcriptional regulator [Actinomadura sp. WMMB 499]|uniref:transcriptional regulator n=1 Tax=Actinomadura sp. WMMB 499 TaxID=1219491 RepID=UPI0020C7E46D|nr:transcriptional regulator [Actinomadura sp. WMMB 499]